MLRSVVVMTPDHTSVHDVWTSHLHGKSLALGMRRRAILVSDIVHRPIFCELDTKSDVMSVHQEEVRIYLSSSRRSTQYSTGLTYASTYSYHRL